MRMLADLGLLKCEKTLEFQSIQSKIEKLHTGKVRADVR